MKAQASDNVWAAAPGPNRQAGGLGGEHENIVRKRAAPGLREVGPGGNGNLRPRRRFGPGPTGFCTAGKARPR
jgi:hypothetical protein